MKIEWGSQMTLDDYFADKLNNTAESTTYKIKKPIRFIEIFGGIGATAAAMERLDCDYELYKYSEWDAGSVAQYNAIHTQDYTDYSDGKSVEELVDWLDNKGVSVDGKEPLLREKILRKGEKWIRTTYNNYIATHNIGSVVSAKGGDLGIRDTDKYYYILSYSFPCQ